MKFIKYIYIYIKWFWAAAALLIPVKTFPFYFSSSSSFNFTVKYIFCMLNFWIQYEFLSQFAFCKMKSLDKQFFFFNIRIFMTELKSELSILYINKIRFGVLHMKLIYNSCGVVVLLFIYIFFLFNSKTKEQKWELN